MFLTTQGEHLKEAAKINSSLSTLGRVIKSLVEVQQKNVSTHVPYRDSKLTFLLQVGRHALSPKTGVWSSNLKLEFISDDGPAR